MPGAIFAIYADKHSLHMCVFTTSFKIIWGKLQRPVSCFLKALEGLGWW